MSIKRITLVLFAMLVVGGFAALGISDAVKTRNRLDFEAVQIKTHESEIKKLDIKNQQLNERYEKVVEEKKADKKELERIKKEQDALNKEKARLKAELQAKIESKNRLANASNDVINAATGTQTASAASGGNVEQIIIAAANKYGVSSSHALRIAKCESTYNPSSVNYKYWEDSKGVAMGSSGARYYPSGLFQHLTNYWPARAAKYGYAGASVFDAKANANVTMAMWRDGNQGLWECR